MKDLSTILVDALRKIATASRSQGECGSDRFAVSRRELGETLLTLAEAIERETAPQPYRVTMKLKMARDLLDDVAVALNASAVARGFTSDAETNCLHHIEIAADSLREVIENYAADYERQVAAAAKGGAQ